jgi:predicted heme/steroid binding protein
LADSETASIRRFTPEELAQYDGKEDRLAYIAYRGKVYDVTASKLWRKGVHVRAHHAGEDLTAAMGAAPHNEQVIDGMPLVGVLIEEPEEPTTEGPPMLVQLSLDHHVHPIAVHFPTGLGAVSPVFLALALLTRDSALSIISVGLEYTAFWCLVVAFLSSVPAIATGGISWYYNYSGVWTPIYRAKWRASVALLLIAALTIAVKLFLAGGLALVDLASVATWIYLGGLVLVAASVVYLGHLGGRITFPS